MNRFRVAGRLLAAFILAVVTPLTSAGAGGFFPFCIDWHDAKERSFEEQAQMLRELGYDGVGHIWPAR